MCQQRVLRDPRPLRHGGGGRRPWRGHEDDGVPRRHHVRAHRGRQIHRSSDGESHLFLNFFLTSITYSQ